MAAALTTDQGVLQSVNAEYERSRRGDFRRLLPSRESEERYQEFLAPERRLNRLPFDTS